MRQTQYPRRYLGCHGTTTVALLDQTRRYTRLLLITTRDASKSLEVVQRAQGMSFFGSSRISEHRINIIPSQNLLFTQ